jgi:hypothetical protein
VSSSADFWARFCALDVASEKVSTFPSIAVDSGGRCFLCKGSDGGPFFLVRTSRLSDRPAFKLKHIRITFDAKYAVDTPEFSGDDVFVRFDCEESNENLRRIFVYSVSAVLTSNPDKAPLDLVSHLVELFRQKSASGSSSVVGLWGELLFMLSLSDIESAVLAWHAEPTQLRDFVFTGRAVEVKTSSSSRRSHFFRLPQVSTAAACDLLCSIMVERTDLGENLFRLIERIESRCSEGIRMKFWEKLLPILEGFDACDQDVSFDYVRALDSIRFYKLAELSKPTVDNSGLGKVQDLSFELLIDPNDSAVTF